jgi:hypothetical protein
MHRLYFLLPDVEHTRRVVSELREAGVPEGHLHVVASSRIALDGLPEASLLQKSEFAHGIEAGLGIGGVAGLLGGLLAVAFPPAGLILGGQAILGMLVAGASLGAVVSGLVAKDMPSHELESFETAIIQGKILLMVDVPKLEVDHWIELIREHYPQAEVSIAQPKAA